MLRYVYPQIEQNLPRENWLNFGFLSPFGATRYQGAWASISLNIRPHCPQTYILSFTSRGVSPGLSHLMVVAYIPRCSRISIAPQRGQVMRGSVSVIRQSVQLFCKAATLSLASATSGKPGSADCQGSRNFS